MTPPFPHLSLSLPLSLSLACKSIKYCKVHGCIDGASSFCVECKPYTTTGYQVAINRNRNKCRGQQFVIPTQAPNIMLIIFYTQLSLTFIISGSPFSFSCAFYLFKQCGIRYKVSGTQVQLMAVQPSRVLIDWRFNCYNLHFIHHSRASPSPCDVEHISEQGLICRKIGVKMVLKSSVTLWRSQMEVKNHRHPLLKKVPCTLDCNRSYMRTPAQSRE